LSNGHLIHHTLPRSSLHYYAYVRTNRPSITINLICCAVSDQAHAAGLARGAWVVTESYQ